jgi:hypothetical protein
MDNMHKYGKSWKKFKTIFGIKINDKLQFWEYVSMHNFGESWKQDCILRRKNISKLLKPKN